MSYCLVTYLKNYCQVSIRTASYHEWLMRTFLKLEKFVLLHLSKQAYWNLSAPKENVIQMNITSIITYKNDIGSTFAPVKDSPTPLPPRHSSRGHPGKSKPSLLLGRCACCLRRSCSGAKIVYSQVDRPFIFKHYFASTSFVVLSKAFTMLILTKKCRLWQQCNKWQQSFRAEIRTVPAKHDDMLHRSFNVNWLKVECPETLTISVFILPEGNILLHNVFMLTDKFNLRYDANDYLKLPTSCKTGLLLPVPHTK